MKVKRVASYETTDGKVFLEKKDAQKHQKNLDRRVELEQLVAAQFPHSPDSERYLDAVTVSDVAQFVLDNADELRAILPQRAKPGAESAPDALDEFIAERRAAQTPATVQ
jgi:dsDNA-binding SOS-regulon protein